MSTTRVGWLAGGIVVGLIVALAASSLLPKTPLGAVATHGQDSFAICTGPIDGATEAIFVLDFVTGDLTASVLSPKNGKFNSAFKYNVGKDLAGQGKNPRYLMVTGSLDLRSSVGSSRVGQSVVYIAEVTSGQMAAYALPWQPQLQIAGQPQRGAFIPLDKVKFRDVAVRGEP